MSSETSENEASAASANETPTLIKKYDSLLYSALTQRIVFKLLNPNNPLSTLSPTDLAITLCRHVYVNQDLDAEGNMVKWLRFKDVEDGVPCGVETESKVDGIFIEEFCTKEVTANIFKFFHDDCNLLKNDPLSLVALCDFTKEYYFDQVLSLPEQAQAIQENAQQHNEEHYENICISEDKEVVFTFPPELDPLHGDESQLQATQCMHYLYEAPLAGRLGQLKFHSIEGEVACGKGFEEDGIITLHLCNSAVAQLMYENFTETFGAICVEGCDVLYNTAHHDPLGNTQDAHF